jgi:hypothetical protein
VLSLSLITKSDRNQPYLAIKNPNNRRLGSIASTIGSKTKLKHVGTEKSNV